MSAIPAINAAAVQSPGRVIHWTRTVAAAVLGIAAIGVMWPALGAGTLWIVPVLVLTAGVAGDAIELRDPNWRLAFPWLWIVWMPIAFVLAGLPAWTLNPLNVFTTMEELAESLVFGLRDSGTAGDAWVLAGWLYLTGLVWFVAAGQARRANRASQAAAFFLFSAPFAAPLAFGRIDDAAWQGGAILVAGLLWATRGNLRDGLPALAVVAVVGVAVAALIAPDERWSGLDRARGGTPATSKFSSDMTFPPSPNFSGSTMFTIRAEGPGLWRGEVLEDFDGRSWSTADVDPGPLLPEPGAELTTSIVRIEGLTSELAFAPGRINAVTGANLTASALAPGTEAVELSPAPTPKSGQTYTVLSGVVPITPALRQVPIPTGPQYKRLTSVFPSDEFPNPAITGNLSGTAYGQAAALAARLSAGTTSELTVVDNVMRYLKESGTFKYSTDTGMPGSYPLQEFLFQTHEGYCQHFAGAAAMLLRMAGVPTRVAAGYGTGKQDGPGQWTVRDEEAHAWIEVYFPGHGWVAFDPTPPQSVAAIPETVGASEKPEPKAPDGAKIPVPLVIGLLGLIAIAYLAYRLIRRPRRTAEALGDVLARVVPAPAGPSMTFDELREDLRAIGPAVLALADEAELQRFGPVDLAPTEHPRRRVWRALLADVGPLRTLRIMVLGPGRRPIVDAGGPKIPSSGPPPSVAPPGAASPG